MDAFRLLPSEIKEEIFQEEPKPTGRSSKIIKNETIFSGFPTRIQNIFSTSQDSARLSRASACYLPLNHAMISQTTDRPPLFRKPPGLPDPSIETLSTIFERDLVTESADHLSQSSQSTFGAEKRERANTVPQPKTKKKRGGRRRRSKTNRSVTSIRTHNNDTGQSEDDKKQSLYKTELCRSFEETGICKFSDRCVFAHGEDELRQIQRHPRYKTEICRSFYEEGWCKYGRRCCFLHVSSEAESSVGICSGSDGTDISIETEVEIQGTTRFRSFSLTSQKQESNYSYSDEDL